VKLTIHLHLVPRLRINEATIFLPGEQSDVFTEQDDNQKENRLLKETCSLNVGCEPQ
jgi:hypothetical protein